MSTVDFTILFQQFGQIRAAVLGDVMLDTYWWGHVDRISPEAPVPVVALDRKEYRIGGAGNVALNLSSLGASVCVFSAIGDDADGRVLKDLFEDNGILTKGLVADGSRVTTSKSRIISRNQQMLRLDAEMTTDLSPATEKELLERLEQYLSAEKPQVLIFEDYNKGVLTASLIQAAIDLCKKYGVLSAVDPKRKNFLAYRGVDIFKPNLKEVKEGLNFLFDDVTPGVLENIHARLHEQLQHAISFITLSEKGVFYGNSGEGRLIASHLRRIADVSGAGDTVIAVASLVYAITRNPRLMAEVANIAGGLVCEEVGTVAVNKQRLLEECILLLGAKTFTL